MMRNKIIIEAPAKINLTLDVIGKRDDGYHELETVMHQIDLFDRITLEAREQGIKLAASSTGIPLDEDNLAYKAALAILKRYGQETGVSIFIEKNIPIGAGLAGGSTDAAAVLAGINYLYGARFSYQDLLVMAAAIGSDVAFCLSEHYSENYSGILMSPGATAIARGRGEILEPLPAQTIPFILMVKPGFQLSTAQVYGEFGLGAVNHSPDTGSFLQAWYNNDIINIAAHMGNVLESVSIRKKPEIGIIKARMKEQGAINALMSGSGPSVFGIFPNEAAARQAFTEFKQDYREVYLVSSYRRGDRNGRKKTVTGKP